MSARHSASPEGALESSAALQNVSDSRTCDLTELREQERALSRRVEILLLDHERHRFLLSNLRPVIPCALKEQVPELAESLTELLHDLVEETRIPEHWWWHHCPSSEQQELLDSFNRHVFALRTPARQAMLAGRVLDRRVAQIVEEDYQRAAEAREALDAAEQAAARARSLLQSSSALTRDTADAGN